MEDVPKNEFARIDAIKFVYDRASNRQLLQYVAGSCILRSK